MDFVVNEWLPEYFRPDASQEEKILLETFLQKFMQKEDRIFVKQPSEFLNKIYRYAKLYQTNSKVYSLIVLFINLVLRDSRRCVFVNDDIILLPEQLQVKLQEGNYASDTYLFEAASITENKVIITTDVRLRNHLRDISEYHVTLLKDFIADY